MAVSLGAYLPLKEKWWGDVQDRLKKLANGIDKGLDAYATTVQHTPYWVAENPPMLTVLKKALDEGDYFTRESFCEEILPFVAKKVLEMDSLFKKDQLPVLLQGRPGKVTFTRWQCCSLLSAAFFGLLGLRANHGRHFQSLQLVDIVEYGFFKSQRSKCLCILGYFHRLFAEEQAGNQDYLDMCITIERRRLTTADHAKVDFWKSSNVLLGEVESLADGVIEEAHGCLQVDFANEMIGGGVLQQGNVQEEIRFVINPECLVSLLCCEVMAPDESILMIGTEQFSTYSGYGGSFTYTGPYADSNPIDDKNHRAVSIIAIDAIPAAWLPGGASFQFTENAVLRELAKSFCGFDCSASGDSADGGNRISVATGNWGCGAFGGNKELKMLIQWMSASQARRKMLYFTFRDPNSTRRQMKIYKALKKSGITVGQLYCLLTSKEVTRETGVYDYILQQLEKDENPQEDSETK